MPSEPRKPSTRERIKARRAAARQVHEDTDNTVVALGDYRPEGKEYREGTVPAPGRHDDTGDRRSQRKFTLGKRWTEIVRAVEAGDYTWEDFTRTLDADELARGQLKGSNGGFGGRPPTFVPRAFYLQCVREIRRRFDEKMQERLLEATDELIELSRAEGGLTPKDRAKVLQYLIERVMGPIPREVTIRSEQPWEDLVVGVFGVAPEGMKAPGEERYEEQEQGDD